MDMSRLPIQEIYQFAIRLEQAGIDLYGKLIDSCAKTNVKKELEFLQEEEAQHRTVFQEEMDAIGGGDAVLSPELLSIIEKDFVRPMQEFCRRGNVTRSEEALRLGADLEQKSIDFYVNLYDHCEEAAFRDRLKKIIAEEEQHKRKLSLILAY